MYLFVFSGKSFTDFNWQKAMIQSRIMEKVQNVGKLCFFTALLIIVD